VSAIRPFRFDVPQADIDDLRRRLAQTRWPERETPEDWSQGIPLAYMQEICEYWQRQYDWRRCEVRLNALPQFITDIDGLAIQFLHARSPHPGALPLVMTHGWPGSVLEFMKVLGPLTDPPAHGGEARDAFHVVCPTLPGFGWSGKPQAPGWSLARIGRAWGTLMARLGYERYVAQGGDWGSAVTLSIAATETARCAGIHTNMPLVSPSAALLADPSEFERAALASIQYYWDWDSGYSKEQSTRPQTVGYALTDSPVGQAAWILEKFHAWTDCDGHPENVLTRDELLDNVMLYWLPAAAASSARMYWENFAIMGRQQPPVDLPTGVSVFPKEILRCSRRWAEERFRRLVHFNILDKGGHFAAFERPDVFVAEIRSTFGHVR
jgi:pimeloyl-ACP methyl ester carboxylesterase